MRAALLRMTRWAQPDTLALILTALGFTCCLVFAPTHGDAQTTQSTAQRRALLNRYIQQITEGDQQTRIFAFDEAMRSKDRLLKQVLIKTAFASSDPNLREEALAAVFASSPTLILRLLSPSGQSRRMLDISRGHLELHTFKFNANDGSFYVYSRFSPGNSTSYDAGSGTISGDQVSFELPLYIHTDIKCEVLLDLAPASPKLNGSFTCDNGAENETAEVDLAR